MAGSTLPTATRIPRGLGVANLTQSTSFQATSINAPPLATTVYHLVRHGFGRRLLLAILRAHAISNGYHKVQHKEGVAWWLVS